MPIVKDAYGNNLNVPETTLPTEVVSTPPQDVITSDVLASTATPLTLPPATPTTAAMGTEAYIETQNKNIKAQQEKLAADEAKLKTDATAITTAAEDLGKTGEMREEIYKAEGVDTARAQVDDYSSQIEAEQLSNRRRVEELKRTTGGVLTSGINAEINRVSGESISKQADLAILQSAALRKYSTAAAIADRKLEAKLEPMRTKLETLKFFYTENKASFDKKDNRLYAELIANEEKKYNKVKETETQKNELLKTAIANGASEADIRVLVDPNTTYETALKTSQGVVKKAANKQVAKEAMIATPFVNRNGEFFDARTGEAAPTPEVFFKMAGVKSFQEAYRKGLITDLNTSRMADLEFAQEARTKYPEAGVLVTDSPEDVARKVKATARYQKETYIEPKNPIIGGYTEKQRAAITKLNNDIVTKSETYKKTTSMRAFADNVIAALQQGTGVSDIAAINQFQKVIDEGAVTRDQDVKLIQQSQSLADGLKLKITKLQKGEQLSTTQRQEMRQLIESLYSNQVTALKKDPFIAAKTKEAELNEITIQDTIIGELSGFGGTTGGPQIEYNGQLYDVDAQGNMTPANSSSGPSSDMGTPVNITPGMPGLNFNSAGNASASKSFADKIEQNFKNLFSVPKAQAASFTDPQKTTTSPIVAKVTSIYPQGKRGGQCTTFLHKLVEFPSIGDGKNTKFASVNKLGILASNWKNQVKVGDVIVTGENKTYGHTAMVNAILPNGKVRLTESNFKGDERVTHTREISINSPIIYGAIRGKLKV